MVEDMYIQYHIVWCVKYRHKIFIPKIEKRLLEILNAVSECENFQILEANADKDHIHLLINCSPHHYIPNIVQNLKGVSSRILMKEFGELLSKRLWGRTFVESVLFCGNSVREYRGANKKIY